VSGPTEIEIFVDASCRYSHYGLATIRRVFDELASEPGSPAIVPSWRFLRLHDLEPPEGLLRATYQARDGQSAEEIAAGNEAVRKQAAAIGVRIDDERFVFVSNPLQAHRLLAMARDDGGDDVPDVWALMGAIGSANFSRGLDIADLGVLCGACEDAGLEVPGRLWSRLTDPDDHLPETLADRAYAQSIDLDGVPRLRVHGTIIPAWLPLDEVRATLRAALLAPAPTPTPA
jgi:predicted DsbA family dithiol-disulfide isomerase